MTDTENDTSKDEGIPEKIWVNKEDVCMVKITQWYDCCNISTYHMLKDDIEYVNAKSLADKKVADAIAPIREVYEKYDHLDKLLSNERLLGYGEDFERNIRFDLWQAIKATVKRKEIET